MTYDDSHNHDRREEVKHGGILNEELPRSGVKKKKDTKKWCKGKEGVKHVWSLQHPYDWSPDSTVEVCDNCGKNGKFTYKESNVEF